jgi:ABC-type glycerol-3-phosphate transport system permease component
MLERIFLEYPDDFVRWRSRQRLHSLKSGDLLLPQLSAASLLAIGPILLVGLLTQRTFVRGLTFGAVQ